MESVWNFTLFSWIWKSRSTHDFTAVWVSGKPKVRFVFATFFGMWLIIEPIKASSHNRTSVSLSSFELNLLSSFAATLTCPICWAHSINCAFSFFFKSWFNGFGWYSTPKNSWFFRRKLPASCNGSFRYNMSESLWKEPFFVSIILLMITSSAFDKALNPAKINWVFEFGERKSCCPSANILYALPELSCPFESSDLWKRS